MLKIAKLAAEEAGKILLRHYGKVSTDSIRSKQANDFMSFVDEASEEKIISIIKKKYPSHNILAEESGLEQQKSDWQWIVDPLDGTTNFLKQIPAFCISIALAYKKKMALGVIYDPLKNELFSAENGKGAYLNHKPIAVSTQPSVEKAFVATGFPFKSKDMMPQFQNLFYDIFIKTMGMRRMGAAALDLAYTACGRFDAYYEFGINAWDIAAGSLLVSESGGTVSDFWNQKNYLDNHYILATNSLIHKEMLKIIKKHFPTYKPIYTV
jgi:myo-inositol-1(or 4)-monophosphatase